MELKENKIEFIETKGDYVKRTLKNVLESDATLIISCNLNTPGERLTLKFLNQYKKPYLILKIVDDKIDKPIENLFKFIEDNKIKILNIAGNSLYRYKISQEKLNNIIFEYLKSCPNINKIEKIQSGGQTGTDESGIKAGLKLNIKTKINVPKNWMFRDINGKDICNKDLFIKRFYPSLEEE